MTKKSFTLASLSSLLILVTFFCSTTLSNAQPQQETKQAEPGFITGRIFNAATGSALRAAQVSIAGSTGSVETDDIGNYTIGPLAPGEKRLIVTYTGLQDGSATVRVESGKTVQKDIDLTVPGGRIVSATGEDIVVLEKYTVITDRDLSAAALALNERRTAAGIKNVVAIEEYGSQDDKNIGDFLRFLPGVALDESGDTAAGVSLRGMPTGASIIQLDGMDIGSSGDDRAPSLVSIPMGNVVSVEVTKAPTPDMPAAGVGGSLNLKTGNPLAKRKSELSYTLFLKMLDTDMDILGDSPGPNKALSPRFKQPSFNMRYTLPVSRNLAFNASISRIWESQPMSEDRADTQVLWNLVSGFQREARWLQLAHLEQTESVQVGVVWRVSRGGMLTLNLNRKTYSHELLRMYMSFGFGGGATGDHYSTQGSANGAGTILQGGATNREGSNTTLLSTLKYTHNWGKWKMEMQGSWSDQNSKNKDIDNGYFNSVPTRIQNVVLYGEGIGENGDLLPARWTAHKNGEPIDIYSAENYVIGNPTSDQSTSTADKIIGRLDIARDFFGPVPFSLKAGAYYDLYDYNKTAVTKTWTFSPKGVVNLASNFDVLDQNFNMRGAPDFYGHKVDWISMSKMYQLYQQHPDWFPIDEVATHKSLAANMKELKESVAAFYLRGDIRLFDNRLWIVAGARYERTDDEGRGQLNDARAIYVQDENGNIIYDANNQPILVTTDKLEEAKLQYQIKGAHIKKHYGALYPSVNMSFNITPDFVVRAAYARTLRRPNPGRIIPGSSVSTVTETETKVLLANPELRPWESDGFDLSFETYAWKGGSGSIGIFQKNLTGFWETTQSELTNANAYMYGLGENPEYDNGGWTVETMKNGGSARVRGIEFDFKQKLLFLPHWARGLRVFFNYTKLQLDGSNSADFSEFAPEKFAGGIDLSRPRFRVMFAGKYQGETRKGRVAPNAANGVPEGTYNYNGKMFRMELSMEYSITKYFSIYASASDIEPYVKVSRQYAPSTPEYARDTRKQELGRTISIGIKGTF